MKKLFKLLALVTLLIAGGVNAQFLAPLWQPTPLFTAQLQSTLVPVRAGNAAGYTPTYSRASTAYQQDYAGNLNLALSGESRFQGAYRVYNLIPVAGTGSASLAVAADKTMTLAAGSYVFSMGAGTGTATFSGTGGATGTLAANASNRTAVVKTITAGTLIVTASVATLVDLQVQDVTGQAYQAPGPYVSCGVLSAPYHGAGVDCVKYYTTMPANIVSSTGVVTDATGPPINNRNSQFGYMAGVNGVFSTPDSSASSITGDIDLRWYGNLPDWTPSSAVTLIGKDTISGNQRSYWFSVQTTGALEFTYTSDGSTTTGRIATSSAVNTITDGTSKWVRVTYATSSGNTNFYTSDDGSTWTALGTQQTITSGNIYDGTAAVYVGAQNGGATRYAIGNAYRAQIYNGIDGTLAVDFNPGYYTSGTTWVSGTTGETWTVNGNAYVFTGAGLFDSAGPTGYLSEGSRTNQLLQSQTLGTTWTVSNAADMNAVTADQYVAPDGTTTMDKLQPKATTAIHSLDQALTFAASVQTVSGFFNYIPATPQRWIALVLNDGTTTWAASFDLLNCAAGALAANTTSAVMRFPNNICRVAMTTTATAAAAGTVKISLNGSDSATLQNTARAGTETLGAWGLQAEAAGFRSTYIPTTTIAVTRSSDLLTYPNGVPINSVGSVSVSAIDTAPIDASTVKCLICEGNRGYAVINAATNAFGYNDRGSGISGTTFPASGTSTVSIAVNAWSGSTGSNAVGGTLTTGMSFDGNMQVSTPMAIGQSGTDASYFFGPIRNVNLYPYRLTDSTIRQLTTPR